MERRTFVQSSIAAVCAVTAEQSLAADDKPKSPELYELRTYHLKAAKQPLLDVYLSKAFIPALKRYGIGPVGVFVDSSKKDTLKVYVLIVHPSPEGVATLSARLAADEEHQKAAKDYLAAHASEAIYTRVESSLLAAIEGMPKLNKPDATKPRLMNLRIYESHNERAGKKKIEMFNKGEIDIFKKTGLTPVFFGEAILGSAMPNLTYMLVFPDDAGRLAAWDKFRADPDWKKISSIPEYANKEIISNITNILMSPTAYSEI
ncbi:MAG: NIPSNAP family protein [Planctomycetes bacterium]|nr:NIPSNAP family protein [Planctomycetota bacterium]